MVETPKRLFIVEDSSNAPVMGVGPGAPIIIIKTYFPTAKSKIRISSAFFTTSGFKVSQKYIPEGVRIWILVGKEDSKNVVKTVIDEVKEDLQRPDEDLWQSAYELLERLRAGEFKIVDARAMALPFHSKFYLVDDHLLLHGSSNYSKKGLCLSIEQLDSVTDPARVNALAEAFEEYFKLADPLTDELIRVLEDFLRLEKPFDVYLKTLLALNFLPDRPVRTDGNLPIYYQKAVVARALRQIEQWGGAFVVAATGLGKTVMGAEIALQLQAEGKIKRVILLSPAGNVQDSWICELEARDIPFKPFTNTILFRENKDKAGNQQIAELERRLDSADENTLILIDEAHIYRNQLLAPVRKGRQSWVIERLSRVVNERNAKIVLLTATPYSTSMLNLNSLLTLLPHRMSKGDLFGSLKEWQVKKVMDFGKLQVVTIIGLPHVIQLARQRGDIDENGRVFIQFHNDRKYPPKKLLLVSPVYKMPVMKQFQAAWSAGCFDQHRRGMNYVVFDDARTARDATLAQIDYIRNSSLDAWLSSPVALKAAVMKNASTEDMGEKPGSLWNPGEGDITPPKSSKAKSPNRVLSSDEVLDNTGSYHIPLKLALRERMPYLQPLQEGLQEIQNGTEADDKFQQLLKILDERCKSGGKAIIFTCLRLTASYLKQALNEYRPSLRVESTVTGQILKPVWERQRLQKSLAPKANRISSSENDLDVLICTDADSMGVNLQDADTVIRYDLPREADKIIQRVGRVLRPTENPDRTVYLYVLLPKDLNVLDSEIRSVLFSVQERFSRINRRHDNAQMILNAPVMPTLSGKKRGSGTEEINLDREIDVQELLENSQGVLGELIESMETSSAIKHQAILEDPQYKERAQNLRENIFSAMEYQGRDPLIYVLFGHKDKYRAIVFNMDSKKYENLEDTQLLDLIACLPTTPTAPMKASFVEQLANRVTRKWCKDQNANMEEVRKICSLYLPPKGTMEVLLDLLLEDET